MRDSAPQHGRMVVEKETEGVARPLLGAAGPPGDIQSPSGNPDAAHTTVSGLVAKSGYDAGRPADSGIGGHSRYLALTTSPISCIFLHAASTPSTSFCVFPARTIASPSFHLGA